MSAPPPPPPRRNRPPPAQLIVERVVEAEEAPPPLPPRSDRRATATKPTVKFDTTPSATNAPPSLSPDPRQPPPPPPSRVTIVERAAKGLDTAPSSLAATLTPPSRQQLTQSIIETQLAVDFLLPTGIMLTLTCRYDMTMAAIKQLVWQEAAKKPLFALLGAPTQYSFVCINARGEVEQLIDTNRRLGDVHFFRPVLRVVEEGGNSAARRVDEHINLALPSTLGMLSRSHDPEADAFRASILTVCRKAIEQRVQSYQNIEDLYAYPPAVVGGRLPRRIRELLETSPSLLLTIFFNEGGQSVEFKLQVEAQTSPPTVISRIFEKLAVQYTRPELPEHLSALKVRGRRDYLLGGHPLIDYRYVRERVLRKEPIEIMLAANPALIHDTSLALGADASKILLQQSLARWERALPSLYTPSAQPLTHLRSTASIINDARSTTLQRSRYSVHIKGATNVITGTVDGIFIRAGLYHGDTPLCASVRTVAVAPTMSPTWNETLVFAMSLRDLPRSARLCITIETMREQGTVVVKADKRLRNVSLNDLLSSGTASSSSSSSSARHSARPMSHRQKMRNEDLVPIAWVNTSVFDYCGRLRLGTTELHTWPCSMRFSADLQRLNPTGTAVANPDRACACALSIQLPEEQYAWQPVEPKKLRATFAVGRRLVDEPQAPYQPYTADEVVALRAIFRLDPLTTLRPSEIELLRRHWQHCLGEEGALPKILRSVRWGVREEMEQAYTMLQQCRPLDPADAIALLGPAYPDALVRSFAVGCLAQLEPDQLVNYLPQLVQALRHEIYLECDLASFLLTEALQNQTVGHYFFWYLRAEMDIAPESRVRFGLLLEAYLRSCESHLDSVVLQCRAMREFEVAAVYLKSLDASKMKRPAMLAALRDHLRERTVPQIEPFQLPHNPAVVAGRLRPDSCRFFSSKKLPLLLVFANDDPSGSDVVAMFKHGDDLRQDMLSLQMISIMDDLWQRHGLDLKMLPYKVLSTGDQVGLIEVVTNSTTLCDIQLSKGGKTGAVREDPLRRWLEEVCTDAAALEHAVDNFTRSCAGYSVATYVMGIGDRHNDNIMMTGDGRIFHIDFGHFLGHFKSKFGVRRERAPFVHVPAFVYVIGGKEGERSPKYQEFKELCVAAFLVIRRNANLLLNLFTMMVYSGIPELESTHDIEYMRDMLFLDMDEVQAGKQFDQTIDAALSKAPWTCANWTAHLLKHAKTKQPKKGKSEDNTGDD